MDSRINIVWSPGEAGASLSYRYMATAGFLSPRMKEREQAKIKKTEKLIAAEEVNMQTIIAQNVSLDTPFGSFCGALDTPYLASCFAFPR